MGIAGVLSRTWLSSEVLYLVPASSNGTMVATTRLHSPVAARVSLLSMVVEDTGAVALLAVCQTASTVMSLKALQPQADAVVHQSRFLVVTVTSMFQMVITQFLQLLPITPALVTIMAVVTTVVVTTEAVAAPVIFQIVKSKTADTWESTNNNVKLLDAAGLLQTIAEFHGA